MYQCGHEKVVHCFKLFVLLFVDNPQAVAYSAHVGVVEKPHPPPLEGSSTERWSRNTQRAVTARVFYVPSLF